MATPCLHHHLLQFHYHGIAKSTCQTYQSGLTVYLSFCSRFNIDPTPANYMTLHNFCADRSQYKTLKVYLAAIHMMHIKQGLPDPTTNESLHLVCRGICHQQNTPERKKLPITINLLRTLKSQLRLTSYSSVHALVISFYAFLHSSEYLSLTWSDITITDTRIVIALHQSKTDPFRRGQSTYIYQTMTSTCPVQALRLYANRAVACYVTTAALIQDVWQKCLACSVNNRNGYGLAQL